MRLATVFVASVVAMMAPTAWAAATAHLTMTVGGSSTYAPTPGETFRVDVYIQADSPMVSWGMQLRDEALILLPEPATLSLFALGGLALLRRRR